jgi:hypothetical protein
VAGVLRRLTTGGLIAATADRLVAPPGVLEDAVRAHPSAPPPMRCRPTDALEPDRPRDAVLRTFLADGWLRQIPVAGNGGLCWCT